MHEIILSGLTRRHAELTGEAQAIRSRLAQIDADLVHLAAVIRQFDPACDIEGIRPKRPAGPDVARRGERSRLILDVLREAGRPLTAAEIVQGMLLRLGQDPEDRAAARGMAKPVDTALGRQEKRRTVRAEREVGRLVLWEVSKLR